MKKLLILLSSFTITLTPATQIISCVTPVDNTFKTLSDIEKYWDFKEFKTISIFDIAKFGDDNKVTLDKTKLENLLKNLIAYRFKNEDNLVEEDQFKNLKFNFYYSNGNNLDVENDLISYLGSKFTEYNNEQANKTIYFTYNKTETSESSKLPINITNIPTLNSEFDFNNFTFTDGFYQLDSYFLSSKVTWANISNGTELIQNSTSLKFIKGILKTLQSKNSNLFFERRVSWENYSIKGEVKAGYILLSPEQQFINWIISANKNTEFKDFFKKLQNGEIVELATVLGITTEEKKIQFQKK
ncbi:lipoprotein [Spiroplasma taiwanense]|uniref:Lipoprotein n=1 Tax=Spiroplasma taiwanense CT-1 TaxID=1276220 RepID=S5MBW3_9MOLU|nr:lipoprotein [Spiroplasma taiwanense]AGR41228.1 hypothetical protein STAIW_v1c06060 [Spiroplasma taiwanense CT-1]